MQAFRAQRQCCSLIHFSGCCFPCTAWALTSWQCCHVALIYLWADWCCWADWCSKFLNHLLDAFLAYHVLVQTLPLDIIAWGFFLACISDTHHEHGSLFASLVLLDGRMQYGQKNSFALAVPPFATASQLSFWSAGYNTLKGFQSGNHLFCPNAFAVVISVIMFFF